jgi:two-component system response regulator AtoC
LAFISERSPQTDCIMLTADDRTETVVRAVKLGAYDYLVKPITPNRLLHTLGRALERRRLLDTLLLRSEGALQTTLRNPAAFGEIVTANPRMLTVLHEAEMHAASDIPVLIVGETGVGKELLARGIHRASPRGNKPFVAVNMLAVPPTLFESEFFGHARGAFTGADKDRDGLLTQADGGVLFLDEIADLSFEVQGKLLQLLQDRQYRPVGRTATLSANVRFIAATNRDLGAAMKSGRFRRDLYYRLQFATLRVPPLRGRLDDLPLLANAFLSRLNNARIAEPALAALGHHTYPGNVRELQGLLQAAANLADGGMIQASHLRLPEATPPPTPRASAKTVGEASDTNVAESLATIEQQHIMRVYESVNRNKTAAAKILGIGLRTLHRKLAEYGEM